MTRKYLNGLTYQVTGAAIDVHKELGSGLLESNYEKCLFHLLKEKGLKVSYQQRVPIVFHGFYLECDLRYDVMVEDQIIVEVKVVDSLLLVHEAQLLTYLRLTLKPQGLLLNLNCINIFREGQKTFVTDLFAKLPKF